MSADRKLSVGLLFAIAVQAAAMFLWAGAASARIATMEAELIERRPVAERLARVEARLYGIETQLDRIEDKIDAR